MPNRSQAPARCKIFAADPIFLQLIIDELRATFGRRVILSQIQMASEGDYFSYCSFFKEAVA